MTLPESNVRPWLLLVLSLQIPGRQVPRSFCCTLISSARIKMFGVVDKLGKKKSGRTFFTKRRKNSRRPRSFVALFPCH